MSRIEQIKEERNKLYKELQDLDNATVDLEGSYEEFERRREPFYKKLGALSREERTLMIPEYEELPDYGDVMSLKNFISCVRSGMFIDYDGSGNYVKDGKMSNIDIYPSDLKYNAIRNDFDTIIWFNK